MPNYSEINTFPQRVVCACTSAEGHKRERLGVELNKIGSEDLLITTAQTCVPEILFNGLRKPGLIAALKVAQQIPGEFSSIKPFTVGVMNAELLRVFPQIEKEKLTEKAIQIYEEMYAKRIPLTLTATDVVLKEDHPSDPTYSNINQPGNVSDEELTKILVSKVGDCGDPRLIGGLIPANFTVGMAAGLIDLSSGNILGQSGEIEKEFSFRPICLAEIKKYVNEHGERARKVNGGIMWEYWQDYIEVINGVGRERSDFKAEMEHLMAMTSGIPMEMSGFLYDLSNGSLVMSQGCRRQSTSELKKLAKKYLGCSLSMGVSWQSWYSNCSGN